MFNSKYSFWIKIAENHHNSQCVCIIPFGCWGSMLIVSVAYPSFTVSTLFSVASVSTNCCHYEYLFCRIMCENGTIHDEWVMVNGEWPTIFGCHYNFDKFPNLSIRLCERTKVKKASTEFLKWSSFDFRRAKTW